MQTKLFRRDFTLVVIGQIISLFGNAILRFALPLYLLDVYKRQDMDLLCIDHCREGRIEQEVGQNAFSYLEAGDLRVDRRIHHSGKVEFPLSHYHGISIGFQMETAAKEIPASMKDFSVDLYELQKKYCSDRTPYCLLYTSRCV